MLGTQERTGISWKDFRNMLRNEKKKWGEKRRAVLAGEGRHPVSREDSSSLQPERKIS